MERVNILGVHISAINMQMALDAIQEWVERRAAQYVCVTPAHGVMDCQENPELKHIFNNSGMTTPDGMAIVWLLKLRGQKHVERVYGPDLLLAACAHGLQYGWKHYFYGGAPDVPQKLVARLQARFPDLRVAGHHSPPFRELTPEEDEEMAAMIRAAAPDILWVGISTPKQERWMAAQLDRLGVPVLVGIGAAFDFHAGVNKQAPPWVQRSGLEWLFRLLSEPRRLWRRYIRYPRFVVLALLQLLGIHKYA